MIPGSLDPQDGDRGGAPIFRALAIATPAAVGLWALLVLLALGVRALLQ